MKDYSDKNIGNEKTLALWLLVILLVLPALSARIFGFAFDRWNHHLIDSNLDASRIIPRAWTSAFKRSKGKYVRVWLNDGQNTIIGGKFSDQSVASTDDGYFDLFIEEVWTLDEDGWFVAAQPNSAGVWISPQAIQRVSFTEELNV